MRRGVFTGRLRRQGAVVSCRLRFHEMNNAVVETYRRWLSPVTAAVTLVILGSIVPVTADAQGSAPAGDGQLELPQGTYRPALEISSQMLGPYDFGVRHDQRQGTGLWLGFRFSSELEENVDDSYALALGAEIGLLEDRLRIQLGGPIGLDDSPLGATAGVTYLAVRSPRLGFGVGLSMWFPLESRPGQIYRLRLHPSLDFAVRFGERWTARTRQGLMLDTAPNAAVLWASAYALDMCISGPFVVGLEALLLLGSEYGLLRAAPALALNLGMDMEYLRISLGFRYGFTASAARMLGRFSVLLVIGLTP